MQNCADHTRHQRAPMNVNSSFLSSYKTSLLQQVKSDTASSCTCQVLHSWEAPCATKHTNVQGTHMANELQIYKSTWRVHSRLNFYWDFFLTWKSIYVQQACDTSAEHFQAISVQAECQLTTTYFSPFTLHYCLGVRTTSWVKSKKQKKELLTK